MYVKLFSSDQVHLDLTCPEAKYSTAVKAGHKCDL